MDKCSIRPIQPGLAHLGHFAVLAERADAHMNCDPRVHFAGEFPVGLISFDGVKFRAKGSVAQRQQLILRGEILLGCPLEPIGVFGLGASYQTGP